MLTLNADVVLHADRHWRGHFGTGKAGHYDTLIVAPATNNLFCEVQAIRQDQQSAGRGYTTAATLVKELQGPIYPWEEKVVTTSLTGVHMGGIWHPVGDRSAPILMRYWLWMHIKLEQDSRDRWLVWLDEQLTHGRLLG